MPVRVAMIAGQESKNRSIASRSCVTGAGGQRRQEPRAVAHRPQPRIEHGEHAAILPVTDQAAEPLLQREDRQRDLVFAERRSRRAR